MLALALLLLGVQGAWADEVSFIERSWDATGKKVVDTQRTISTFEKLEGNHSDDWKGLGAKGTDTYYVVNGNVSYQTLVVHGRVHLILADKSRLICTGGIKVEALTDAQLFIYSQSSGDSEGTLVVTNSYKNAAGIGSSKEQHCGPLTIHGGVIDATGAAFGAGIGSGACTSDIATLVADIVVYGGRVTGRGGESGAGIGGGSSYRDANFAHGGKFTIYGGKVSAIGGKLAAGLGGGGGYSIFSDNLRSPGGSGGEVYVYGGHLTAVGGTYGAGIGSGSSHNAARHGGKLYVDGGEVTATGGDFAAAIGGGIFGNGADVTITGGIVTASSGNDNLRASYLQDNKSGILVANHVAAFGNGWRDKRKYAKLGTLSLPDNYMVTAGVDANHIERVFTAGERIDACYCRYYARIEACPHTKQNNDADDLVTTYTLTDSEHTSHCRYCNYTVTTAHDYSQDADCVCGKVFDAQTDVVAVNVYSSIDGKAYGDAKTDKVVKAHNFALPKPVAVEGLTFMGYLKAETAPESIEMKDSEMQSLVDAGSVVTPKADSTYYARYRYDYTDEWTWAEDHASATVTVTWANGDAKLENLKATVYADSKEPTADDAGYKNYTATYAYQKAEDITYKFTDNITITHFSTLSLVDNGDNGEIIRNNQDALVDKLTLSSRTFYKDGSWNTLCLPFAVENFAGTPLEDATVMELDAEKSSLSKDGLLTLSFKEAKAIEAGKPYIMKWAAEEAIISINPTFHDVTISSASPTHVEFSNAKGDACQFVGQYSSSNIAYYNINQIVLLSKDNTLGYSQAPRTLRACRAFFVIPTTSTAATVRGFKIEFDGEEATGIFNVSAKTTVADGAYYDLQGRKLEGKPTRSGLYIQNGRKVVIK